MLHIRASVYYHATARATALVPIPAPPPCLRSALNLRRWATEN